MTSVDLLATHYQAYNKKIIYIEFLIGKMEHDVMNTSASSKHEQEYTYTARQFYVRKQQEILEETKHTFTQ